MISTSFLRTLNIKKYQDYAQENKNRLKVFYIRAVNKINKQSKTKKAHTKNQNKCFCKKLKSQRNTFATQTGLQNSFEKRNQKNNTNNLIGRNRPLPINQVKEKQLLEAKQIMLDFQLTRMQYQNHIFKIQRDSFTESRKLSCLYRGRKTEGRNQLKELSLAQAHKTFNFKEL